MAEIVAVLVDETMTVAAGGTIYDDRGKVIKTYEGRLPAVLQFEIYEQAKSFTLEVNGQRRRISSGGGFQLLGKQPYRLTNVGRQTAIVVCACTPSFF